MKDKSLRRFRLKVTVEIVLKILACFAALWLLLLVDGLFNDLIAEALSRYNYTL